MRKNLNAILATMGAAALLAAPAMAKTYHSPSAEDALKGVYGSATPSPVYGAPHYYGPTNEGGPYTPSAPTPSHGQSRDFQNSERGD